MISLRDYQTKAVEMLRASWREPSVLVAPTGSGKTCVAAAIIQGAIAKGRRCMIVAHTRAIVAQTVLRFREAGLETGCIMGAETENTDAPVIVASIQTLHARKLRPTIDVLIIDECHRATSKTYVDIIDSYAGISAVIGLTATPCRLDGKGLGDVGFKNLLEPVSYAALFESGALIKPRIYAPPGPDMSKVRVVAGEFAGIELDEAARTITGHVVEHYRNFANGSAAIAFSVSVDHAHEIAQAFNDAGIPALALSGDSSIAERDAAMAALKAGTLRVVANCQLFSEGFDLPMLETAILARPTASLVLHRQQIGRIMRPSPGKTEAVVIDAAGNMERHGAPWEFVAWSLDSKVERTEKAYGKSLKRCGGCFALYEGEKCPECGWMPEKKDPIEVVDGVLVEWKEKSVEEWYALEVQKASRKGHKLGAARMRYKDKFGDWPKLYKLERQNYVCPRHPWQIDEADEAVNVWTGVTEYACAYCRKKYPSAQHARVGHSATTQSTHGS